MWNYRIIKSQASSYGLYEVIYNDEGEISAHDEEPSVYGESPQEIADSLELMLSDVKKHLEGEKDILEINKIEFAPLLNEEDKEESIEIKNLSEFNLELFSGLDEELKGK